MFRKPSRRELFYLLVLAVMCLSAVLYVCTQGLSLEALFRHGLLQPRGVMGPEARLVEIATPLSWNIPKVMWFIYVKGAAVLAELFQYWVVGMLIAAALVVFVPWERIRQKMGAGGFAANVVAATAGAVIPICSCGIVPVLAGMVEAGIPLGPTMAFLVAAPMLNVPAVFITAGVLGWRMAVGRILGTFLIALTLGGLLSYWQRRERFLRRFVKLAITPNLSSDLRRFAFRVVAALSEPPGRRSTAELAPGQEEGLFRLAEAGILDRGRDGMWFLPQVGGTSTAVTAACFVLPTGDPELSPFEAVKKLLSTAWDLFLQLNYYLILAVVIAGGIKVLIPTTVVVRIVGGTRA